MIIDLKACGFSGGFDWDPADVKGGWPKIRCPLCSVLCPSAVFAARHLFSYFVMGHGGDGWKRFGYDGPYVSFLQRGRVVQTSGVLCFCGELFNWDPSGDLDRRFVSHFLADQDFHLQQYLLWQLGVWVNPKRAR